jgi:inner membrane protein
MSRQERTHGVDSITHLAFGACLGHAIAGRRLGRKALAIGAVAATIPDFDNLALLWGDALTEWRHHRGFTHSIFFAALAGPVLGWLCWRRANRIRPYEPEGGHDAAGTWIALFTACLATHPLLDVFTIYGTQLLAPFSDARFAIPGIAIIDPFYTLLLLAAAAALVARPNSRIAGAFAIAALFGSFVWQLYGTALNAQAERIARDQLAAEDAAPVDVRAYTTIFQPWLRRVVVDEPAGARVAFVSPLQRGAIAWICFTRVRHPAFAELAATPEGRLFDWFAAGDTWPVLADDGARVRLTDRRYGAPGATAQGWWGIEAPVGVDGHLAGPPVRFGLPRPLEWPVVRALFEAALGRANALFPQAADAQTAARACAATRR